ncbi:hypothetical protein BJX64DRAFT_288918 [Aspergillus heterothallicus]
MTGTTGNYVSASDVERITINPVRDLHFGAAYKRLRPEPGGYCISLISRKESLIDGSDENKSVITSTKSSGTLARPDLGNMLAVREISDGTHEDIRLEDFRHLIDYRVTCWRATDLPEPGEIAAD